MSNPNSIPTNAPPLIPVVPGLGALVPLGEHPAEREPIRSPIGAVEAILRQPRRLMYQLRQPAGAQRILSMLVVAILCCLVYGLVVGTFSGGTQLWAARR